MHTFELICRISDEQYTYLHTNLPDTKTAGKHVEKTNYYVKKGITQIELRTFVYKEQGKECKKYYIVLRCNPSVIMGESKISLIDLNKYSADEILNRLLKRLYEINEFRFIKLHERPINHFSLNRADAAVDIFFHIPQLLVLLCNFRVPYGHHKMERKPINKDIKQLYIESCCLCNKSRGFNIYYKMGELLCKGKDIPTDEYDTLRHTVRFEVQIKKKGVINMKLPTNRQITPFLDDSFNRDYLKKEMKALLGIEKFVSRAIAVKLIKESNFKEKDKTVMISIIDMIYKFRGLYELEKAIADHDIKTPNQYGNLKYFKLKWLKKFKQLGIQPVVIPDDLGIDEIPSIYEML